MPRIRSSIVVRNACASASTLLSMLKWVSITPFGSPVEPLLKRMVATSSTLTGLSAPHHASISRAGAIAASSAASRRVDLRLDLLEPDRHHAFGELDLRAQQELVRGHHDAQPRLARRRGHRRGA